jgi:membrane-bound ClpP family serine protease
MNYITKKKMDFVFNKKNYVLLLSGLVLILLGLLLMIGGGSEDPAKFSKEIFNFQRLTLAPILIVSGFVLEIFAIMSRPETKK